VKHERFRRLAFLVDRIETLNIICGAECNCDERLSLAASEKKWWLISQGYYSQTCLATKGRMR